MKDMTILVPLDGSRVAEAALRYAVPIALATRSTLRLLSVAERESGGMSNWPDDVHSYLEQLHMEDARAYLRGLAAALKQRDVPAEALVTLGEPSAEIVEAAADPTVAMMAIATHGRSGLRDQLMGSTAERVLRQATRPVLVVHPRADTGPWRPAVLHRIMVPLDGSERAEAAIPFAADLAAATGATLVLLRVEPWLTAGSAPYGASLDFVRMEETTAQAAQDYLLSLAPRFPAGVTVETEVLRGMPAETLPAYAHRALIDLAVMGTHGRTGLGRLVLGSTADALVQAGVPALLVRPTTSAQQLAAVPALSAQASAP
jgi:nucleotide-binding universal stress UspA family protein